ncbi:P-loop containing nucleoside triphosphate hydrolase protein, partial [Xylogone sp. PMI_703]
WCNTSQRNRRSIRSVILDPKVKADILKDVGNFACLETRRLYEQHNQLHKRGYLFNGPPGNGKSSTIVALASLLGMDIYIIRLSQRSISDHSLPYIFRALPERCMVVMEDVDRISFDTEKSVCFGPDPRVNLFTMLNVFDGIESRDRYLLIMTANHLEKLDKALIRPRRIDRVFPFMNPTVLQGREMFTNMYQEMPYNNEEQNLERFSIEFGNMIRDGGLSYVKIYDFLFRHRKENPLQAVNSFRTWLIQQ